MTTKFYTYLPDEAMTLRTTVFMDEQGFVDDVDDVDAVATHVVVFDGETPVAACRVFRGEDEGTWLVGRFCVAKPYRGIGVGRSLCQAVASHVQSIGGKRLLLHSQCHAVPFYEKAGFTAFGDIEYEQDCPHRWMEQRL